MTFIASLMQNFGVLPVYLYKFTRVTSTDYFTTDPSGYTTTTTAISGTVTVTTVEPLNETTINVTTASGASVDLAAGDQITIAGDAGSPYIVSSPVTIGPSTTGDIVIEAPGLSAATAGGEVVTSTEAWTHKKGVSHSNLRQSANIKAQDARVTFPNSDTFARQFLGPILAEELQVSIRKVFKNDTDQEVVTIFTGRWVSSDPTQSTITLKFENDVTAFRRKGQNNVMQRPCRHAHYHAGCGLTRSTFELTGTATAYDTDTNIVTVTEATGQPAPHDDFRFGVLRYGTTSLAMITDHDGTAITLHSVMPGLSQDIIDNTTATVYLAPGCNLSLERCEQFSNITGTVTVTTVEPTSETTINLTTAASSSVALNAGDVLNIAGDANSPYVVASAATIGASTTGDVVIESPGLVQATAGGEAVTSSNRVRHGGFPFMGENHFDGRQLF